MNKNKKTSLSIILVAVIIASLVYFKEEVLSVYFSVSPWFMLVAVGLITISILVLIFREVLTWYWKINKIISLLEKIEENTRK